MTISSLAGTLPDPSTLIDVPKLVSAYYTEKPDCHNPAQSVSFGTSGHRGSSLTKSFNESHILAITQAICTYREKEGIKGPLFLGIDTHALSFPARVTALEVLAANEVHVKLAEKDDYTPTPVISHAILCYNRESKTDLSDGIVITPSHNPPSEGGFKYNGPDGGPASQAVTDQIQKMANDYLKKGLKGVKRIPYDEALKKATIERYNYAEAYIDDLKNVVDMELIAQSQIHLGVDPLGGAGVHYWRKIKDKYGLNLTIISECVDPTFRFMTLDWDGQIRMDPSSAYAMRSLIGLKDQFDVAFACDTDHDRHGIVAKSVGLLPANHYLSVAVSYLLHYRPLWPETVAMAKTVVTTELIEKIAAKKGRKLLEYPVGFKWFVEGLLKGDVCFACEESAGASFLRFDGTVWSTDKDGIIAALLSAEMTARLKKDPGILYKELTNEFGAPVATRVEIPITNEEKKILKGMTPAFIEGKAFAGKKVIKALTKASANGESIGGIKVIFSNGWCAARPSGTEEFCKIYAEVFGSREELNELIQAAREMVDLFLKKKK